MARKIMLMMLGRVVRIGTVLGFLKAGPQAQSLGLLEHQVTDL